MVRRYRTSEMSIEDIAKAVSVGQSRPVKRGRLGKLYAGLILVGYMLGLSGL